MKGKGTSLFYDFVLYVLMFFSWPLLAVSAFAALMIHLQIVRVEEDFLLASFDRDYVNYRKIVGRYLGRKSG